MTALSSALFLAGYGTVLVAAVVYGAMLLTPQPVLAAGRSLRSRQLLPATSTVVEGMPSFFIRCAAVLLGASIAFRALVAQRPPYADMWEYLVTLAFGMSIAAIVFERRYGERAIVGASLLIMAVLLTTTQLAFSGTIEPLIPALQNNRLLAIHVACMIAAYSALSVAFAASVVYLAQGSRERFARLPRRDAAQRIEHGAILAGFPLLGLGIALGAYWGNIAWGRYWGWDPKESTALASWLVYAVYMHVRVVGSWKGDRVALVSVAGFSCILFNIFVVNFVLAGLHSYAGA